MTVRVSSGSTGVAGYRKCCHSQKSRYQETEGGKLNLWNDFCDNR